MCDDHPLDDAQLRTVHAVTASRRSVLAGAMALAGAGLLGGPTSAAADTPAQITGRRPRPPRPDPLVLTGGTLLDPLTGRVIEDSVLVFAGGRVRAAGPARSRDVQRRRRSVPGAREIDVSGRWVLPGLIDVHVHASTVADAQRALLGGATTLRSASTPFFQDVGVQALAEYQPESTPHMVPAGVFVTPFLGDAILADPDLAPLSLLPDGVRRPDDLAYVTRVNLRRGAEAIKTRATERAGLPEQDPREQVYDRRQIAAVVRAARRRRVPVLCHSHGAEGCQDAVEAGVASLEHGTFASDRTLALMARRGTYLTPTFSAVVDLAEPKGEYTDPRLVERGREMLVALRAVTAEAHDRGVPIVAGTDTSYTAATLSSIGGEVAHIHEAGVPALDAIRAATTTAADLLGLRGEVGRLRHGFRADAVVLNGDPLDDVSALQRVDMVVAGGAVAAEALVA